MREPASKKTNRSKKDRGKKTFRKSEAISKKGEKNENEDNLDNLGFIDIKFVCGTISRF
jgi:hypothetical protein